MVRRQVAYGIGVGGVTGHHVSLAAAAPEIPGFLRAAAARLLHPTITPKVVETRRVTPDPFHRGVSNVWKAETRQHPRRMTGKGCPVGRHSQENRSQTVHARLGSVLVVVGNDEENLR